MKRSKVRTSSAVLVCDEHRPQDRNEGWNEDGNGNWNESSERRRKQEGLLMVANTIPRPPLNAYEVEREKTAIESCAPVTLKQRFEKLLRELFEGHEEFLGATPD